MRIFSSVLVAALIAAAGTASAGGVKYASPQAAFEQGLGAYKSGYYEIAIPALEEAAAKGAELNKFFAEFYLARIYSDNASAVTDHAKAYELFQKLADDNADVDPDDGQRAPFVAKALTALAGYLRRRRDGDRAAARSGARRRLSAPRRDVLRRQGRAVRAGQDLPGRPRHARGREARHALSVRADRGGLSRARRPISPISSGAGAT